MVVRASGGNRTRNLLITNQRLYQLSYTGRCLLPALRGYPTVAVGTANFAFSDFSQQSLDANTVIGHSRDAGNFLAAYVVKI